MGCKLLNSEGFSLGFVSLGLPKPVAGMYQMLSKCL